MRYGLQSNYCSKCRNKMESVYYSTYGHSGRPHSPYGGVVAYVREGVGFIRRPDLEIDPVESIWLEIRFRCNKRLLIGVFYRPPNSDINYFNKIEDSIGLAKDTGINDILITGDFNLNTLCALQNRKVVSIAQTFGLEQCILEPTHFTEQSSSIIDLVFISNKSSLVSC